MAKQVQLRRGTTSENDAFTGAVGELTVDTTYDRLRLHDGSTAGGKVLDEYVRKNWIINGDHQINQRGLLPVTGATDGDYEATDRWKTTSGVVTSDISLSSGRLRYTATSSGSGASIGAAQFIEDFESLRNKTITVSAIIKSNTDKASILIYDGTTVQQAFHSGSGNDENIVITTVVPNSTSEFSVQPRIYAETITSGDYIEFTNVKVEIGDTATPFEKEPYYEVLRKCQRYCYNPITDGLNDPVANGAAYTTAGCFCVMHLPVPMYATPTLSISAVGHFFLVGENATLTATSLVINNGSQYGVELFVNATSFVQGSAYTLRANNGSASFLLEAEL